MKNGVMKLETEIEKARAVLRNARRVVALTGAGVSAESGAPTFRGGGGAGVWRGMPFEVLSSREMVARNLPLVWEWFDYRRSVLQNCAPNAAHVVLAEQQRDSRFDSFSIVTQNIDGLHRAAGARDIIELHGNIWRARCDACGKRRDLREIPNDERPPVCLSCKGSMRPDVVLFGETLPAGAFERAEALAHECDACLVIGTSALVYPATSLPEIARSAGALIIEIDPEETPLTARCDISLRGCAGGIAPKIFEE